MRNTDNFGHGKPATDERILAAAASLFSKLGYNGVSTRDIASAASVNEVTVYRHYPRKRDLYTAVLDAELRRVSLRGELRCGNAKALTLALIAIAGFYEPLYRSLSSDTDGLKATFEAFAETCLGVSFTEPDDVGQAE
jgi:AcrR family transcriptional regulator